MERLRAGGDGPPINESRPCASNTGAADQGQTSGRKSYPTKGQLQGFYPVLRGVHFGFSVTDCQGQLSLLTKSHRADLPTDNGGKPCAEV